MVYSTGSVVVAHGLSWSVAHGIFSDQGLDSRLMHWQVDSSPQTHQGGPDLPSEVLSGSNILLSKCASMILVLLVIRIGKMGTKT